MSVLFFLLACCRYALALNPSLDVNQYAHTSWKIRDGFAKGEIVSVAQTPDGYLWLGTEFGLLRFDGARAVPWEPSDNQQLPSRGIMSLLAAGDGTLWIGTFNGLASWKDGKLNQYAELAGQYIFRLLEDRDGTVWVGGMGSGGAMGRLCSIRKSSVHCDGDDGSLGRGIVGLYQDSKETLWVGVQTGLWRWKPGPAKFYPLPGEPDGIPALAEDVDGALLMGWKGRIHRFADEETQPYPLPGFAQSFRARRILRDRDGGLWIGTHTQGLVHVHEGGAEVFSSVDGLSGDLVFDLFEDHEGSIWVVTTGGLDRFRHFAVTTLARKQGLSNLSVQTVLADRDGSIWITSHGGLDRWNNGRIKSYHVDHPESLLQDDRGRIWISTVTGIGYLENGRFIPIRGTPGGNNISMAQDPARNLWIANEQFGLSELASEGGVRQIPWAELGHEDYASVIAADGKHGGLWMGFFLGGISYFSDGQIRTSYTSADGLGAGRVSDFYFDAEGALWISTEGGLSRLKDNRIATLTSKNGLPCDTVHWAIEDNDHAMWLYTPCGLVRIARSELDAWSRSADRSDTTTHQVHVTAFDNSDGVRSLAAVGHYHPQVANTHDGKLWFLPWDGVSVIDPHHLAINKLPPPVHIEKITADGKTYDASNGVPLPAHVRDVTIDYTALSLVAPEKNHFRYKLEGQDPDWREVVNDRQVQYSNLAPRHYTFRVMACNNSGVWNDTGASLEFSVLPAFYQTAWFRVLCVFGLLAAFRGIYQLRVQQLHRQFAIRLGERTRIARELHDTILQDFQGSLFQMQAARNLFSRQSEKAMQTLDNAIEEAQEAINEGRDAIQGLRSVPMAKGNLAELLMSTSRELANSNTDPQPPVFDFVEEGEPQALSSTVSHDICRIAFEVLRNAYHHAHAQRIESEIRYGDSMFRLRIRDDGKGIDPKTLKEGGKAGHWGLRGLRERAERIGASMELWSELGNGTEVQLLVPASIAYENHRDGFRSKLIRKLRTLTQRSASDRNS